MAKAKNTDKLVVQNAAKTLLANIRFASVDDPIRTITVTSSIPNEGKSTVSINLAQAIATSGKSVLLVEADMRRRSLADMLGVRSAADSMQSCPSRFLSTRRLSRQVRRISTSSMPSRIFPILPTSSSPIALPSWSRHCLLSSSTSSSMLLRSAPSSMLPRLPA